MKRIFDWQDYQQKASYGGHQDAKDGGLDVVVRGSISPPSTSYVSKKITGFQGAKILEEMHTNGVLRESIKSEYKVLFYKFIIIENNILSRVVKRFSL